MDRELRRDWERCHLGSLARSSRTPAQRGASKKAAATRAAKQTEEIEVQ